MPICKNCKREISKFDNDICPYCGFENPIDDEYQTMDITRNITKSNPSYQLYKAKSKLTYSLLCFFLGFLGINKFYTGFNKRGFINLGLSVGIYAIISLVLYFFIWNSYLSFVLPGILIILVFNIIQGILFKFEDSPKDSNGEFLR